VRLTGLTPSMTAMFVGWLAEALLQRVELDATPQHAKPEWAHNR